MKASEVLRKAGDVLRERGWNRWWFYDRVNGTGSVCLLGACHVATNGIPDSHSALEVPGLLDALDVPTDGKRAFWNDAPGRTAAEVMIALDAAYVIALQGEGIEPDDVL